MTQATPPAAQNPTEGEISWSLKGFVHFVKTVINMLLDVFDIIIEPFFKINQTGRSVRSLLFLIGFVIWWIAAYSAHPPQLENIVPWFTFEGGGSTSTQLMLQTLMGLQAVLQIGLALIVPFFAPDIFRHVIVIGLASWIAYQWAGIYLDDIFELRDTKISRKFIRTAAFIGPLEKVHITDGEIGAKHKNSSVVKIGGPGKVLVHMENAALFEKINGTPHIILSEDKNVLLEGFERLRTVRDVPPKPPEGHAIFDRRDQFIDSQNITGRTKDGIIVTAKNINAVFSLHQGPMSALRDNSSLGENGKNMPQIPGRLSFNREDLEEAIANLVYKQVNRPWTETAKQTIFPAVRTWIGQHTLDEFLTNLSPQELAEVRERLQAGDQRFTAVSEAAYLSRAEITNSVQGNPEDGKRRGFDVHWVGVGTWETPDEIPKQHKEAFELSVTNRINGSELELSRIQRESRLTELVRLLQEVPIDTFKDALQIVQRKTTGLGFMQLIEPTRIKESYSKLLLEPEEAEVIKYKMIVAYREKLKNARDWYLRNQQTPPTELTSTINHLSQFPPPS